MEIKSGIWIDSEKAILVTLNNDAADIRVIESPIETRVRIEGETKNSGKFGVQYHTKEKTVENRKNLQLKNYMKKVLPEISHTDELVIFGPANMKRELKKAIDNHNHHHIRVRGVLSADSMTQNQLVAWVKDYYNSQSDN